MGNTIAKKPKKTPKQFLNWFEIPVLDMARAVSFFNHLYGISLEATEQPEYAMALFPSETGTGGALVMGQGCTPSETGTLLYLNAPEDIEVMLNRVEEGGGRVIMSKTEIAGEGGFFALFLDTEGNRLALHANQ